MKIGMAGLMTAAILLSSTMANTQTADPTGTPPQVESRPPACLLSPIVVERTKAAYKELPSQRPSRDKQLESMQAASPHSIPPPATETFRICPESELRGR